MRSAKEFSLVADQLGFLVSIALLPSLCSPPLQPFPLYALYTEFPILRKYLALFGSGVRFLS